MTETIWYPIENEPLEDHAHLKVKYRTGDQEAIADATWIGEPEEDRGYWVFTKKVTEFTLIAWTYAPTS